MRQALTIAGAALLFLVCCDAGFAQVSATPGMGVTSPLVSTTPGMGVTSPLGSPMSNTPSQAGGIPPGGIPLGATELDSGGLSPTASTTPCSSTAPASAGTVGSNSTFDGGGTMSTPTISASCGSPVGSTGAMTSATAGSPITGLTPGLPGPGVPLGSTELGTPGESPATPLPAPIVSGVPCTGISATIGMPGTSGTSVPSTNVC